MGRRPKYSSSKKEKTLKCECGRESYLVSVDCQRVVCWRCMTYGRNDEKRETTTDAVEIMERRYIEGKPERQKELDKERKKEKKRIERKAKAEKKRTKKKSPSVEKKPEMPSTGKKRRGRPPGSKNKTVEKKYVVNPAKLPSTGKGKRGRPPGSKNKPK